MTEKKFLTGQQVETVLGLIGEGKMFSVVFQKRDGTLRRMVCRTGVKAHLKGGESTHRDHPENLVVFDVEANDYRAFNKNNVLRVKGAGMKVEACDVEDIEDPIHNAKGEVVEVK